MVPSDSDGRGWVEGWDLSEPSELRFRMAKRVFVVSDDLCSGCRNCEMWCSFLRSNKKGFGPAHSNIRIVKDDRGLLNRPLVDCSGRACSAGGEEPICVEMCPTGCLIYCNSEELHKKKLDLNERRKDQPVFKLIAPWKYPYPWRRLEREEL